jgi:hypothetical protein
MLRIGVNTGRVLRRLLRLFCDFRACSTEGSTLGGGEDGGVDVGSRGSDES